MLHDPTRVSTGDERLTHMDRTGPTIGLMTVRSDAMSGPYLRTLGPSALMGAPPPGSVPLRTKDFALLVYLCVNGLGKHTRGALATLLWGDRDEVHARHSLTQALRRLRLMVGEDALSLSESIVEWRGPLACDALELERAVIDPGSAEPGLPCYAGDFLVDLAVGHGAGGFSAWADERRAHFRFVAARVLAAQGGTAEELGRWDAALQLGLRLIEIEPMSQQAQRRVMRAWSALGERALAVRHYRQFERWLRDEWSELPDPATRALFDELHTVVPASTATPATQQRAGEQGQQHAFLPDDRRTRSPLPVKEGAVSGTSAVSVPSADVPAPVPTTRRAGKAAAPISPPGAPVATTFSARARRGFVLAVTIFALTAALGAVAVVVSALKP